MFFFGQALSHSLLLFILDGVAIVGLAQVIGSATERLALRLGPALGALLGITFGNIVELLLSLLALREGLFAVVKASVIGGVLANLLLTLGFSMVVGGGAKGISRFNQRKASLNSAMLFVAVIGLTAVSMFSYLNLRKSGAEALSIGVSVVFLLVYCGGFLFSYLTHRSFLSDVSAEEPNGDNPQPRKDVLTLLVATVVVAFVSDQLVASISVVASQLRLSEQFIGLVFLPLIGIAPEFFAALIFARKGQIEGSVEIAVGSSLQISLFVAPLLVLCGLVFGRTLTLVFMPLQVVVLVLTTILVNIVSLDGETHWFEGIMVVATYVIFALMFFFS